MLENSNSWGAFKYLKLVAPQGPTEEFPKFVVQWGKEENYELTDESYTKVRGMVDNIKTTHNGKTGKDEVKWFEAIIVDGDESYVIKTTMSNASKDLANHLLAMVWVTDFINISLYLNKNKYPSSSVKLDNEEFAPTSLDFKGLDKNALWESIKGQEPVSTEEIPF